MFHRHTQAQRKPAPRMQVYLLETHDGYHAGFCRYGRRFKLHKISAAKRAAIIRLCEKNHMQSTEPIKDAIGPSAPCAIAPMQARRRCRWKTM